MIKRSSLLALVLLLAWPAIASAHPAYKDSDPKANSSVSQPPSQLWVEFTERIEGGNISVYDPCGAEVDNGDSQRNLTNDRLTVTMSADRSGTYRVVWKVAGSDSHETSGEFTFSSTGGEPCPGQEPEDPEDEPNRPDRPREQNNSTNDQNTGSAGSPSSENNRRAGGSRQEQDGERRNRSGGSTRVKAEREKSAAQEGVSDIAAPTTPTSIWDGLPIGDFLIALGVAALIGAAGGRIYAGIIGPRR